MELLLEQISQITHGVVLNRIKPKVQSEGIEYPILSISQLLDEENGITDYEVPSVFVDKRPPSKRNKCQLQIQTDPVIPRFQEEPP